MTDDALFGTPERSTGFESDGVDQRPLRRGERVRSTAEPIFSSDRRAGDLGQVVESSATSVRVRWEDGGETWVPRTGLQPLSTGDQIATGAAPDAVSVETSPMPVAMRAPSRARKLVTLLVPIFVFGPALVRLAGRSTLGIVLLAAGVAVGLAVLLVLSRRRAATRRATPDAETTGTIDGQ